MLPVPINPVVPYRASWTIARAAPALFASLNRHNEVQRVPNATSRTNLGVQHRVQHLDLTLFGIV